MTALSAVLEPCPFCGSAVAWCGTVDETDIHSCHQITCPTCGQFDLKAGNEYEELADVQAAVASAWNLRTHGPAMLAMERAASSEVVAWQIKHCDETDWRHPQITKPADFYFMHPSWRVRELTAPADTALSALGKVGS